MVQPDGRVIARNLRVSPADALLDFGPDDRLIVIVDRGVGRNGNTEMHEKGLKRFIRCLSDLEHADFPHGRGKPNWMHEVLGRGANPSWN